MIISCIKCNKKFSVVDKLIPELGRILQCGSCSHQWHYIPILVINKDIAPNKNENIIKDTVPNKADNFINDTDKNKIVDIIKNDEPDIFDNSTKVNNFDDNKTIINDNNVLDNNNKFNHANEKKFNFFNILLIGIITFIALLIILDTFRNKLSDIIPNLDLYLDSLYNTLTDIYLFIINLIK